MSRPAAPEAALLPALSSLGSFVVLRNHDILGTIAGGGDVDVLVPDRKRAERQLIAELGLPLFVARRSYVTGLFYEWGHVDLLSTLEWRGAEYLDAAGTLRTRVTSSWGLPQPRPADEALVSWFSSLLWGGFFKSRYREVILDAASRDGEELERLLRAAAGKRWGRRLWACLAAGRPEQSEHWARPLRRAVWWTALRRAPVRTVLGGIRFCVAEARLRADPPLPWIAILGPDGSGKSSLIAGLRRAWPPSLGPMHTYHLRPRRLDRATPATEPVVDPHAEPPRRALASAAVLGAVLADWWIGYWTRIVAQRAKHGFVVFDRHLVDLLVDPRRYRYGGPWWLARAACRLAPRPDLVVVLDAPPEVVRARKQEVTVEESRRQNAAYRRLAADLPGARLVDATAPPEQVLKAVLTMVREKAETMTAARVAASGRRRRA